MTGPRWFIAARTTTPLAIAFRVSAYEVACAIPDRLATAHTVLDGISLVSGESSRGYEVHPLFGCDPADFVQRFSESFGVIDDVAHTGTHPFSVQYLHSVCLLNR